MRMEYRFARKKNIFSWESDWIRLIFSEPRVYAHRSGYSKCRGQEDIVSTCYTLQVLEKRGSRGKERWMKAVDVTTFDFPALETLLVILEYFLKAEKPDKQWSRFSAGDRKKLYSLTCNTGGFYNEDFFEVTKNIRFRPKREWYELYVGQASGIRSTRGMRIEDLSKNDIEQLKICIEEFLKYAIECYNTENRQTIDVCCAARCVVEGKLYTYAKNETYTAVNYATLNHIFIPGDYVSRGELMHFEEEDYYSETFGESAIIELTETELVLEDGSRLPLDRIVSMDVRPTEEMLHYNQVRITEDFLALMTNAEKADFAQMTEEELYLKYHQAIRNRTQMYREEHNFPQTCEDLRENVHRIIRKIIHDIKKQV